MRNSDSLQEFCLDRNAQDLIACKAGVSVQGEQKAAAGEGQGLKNREGKGMVPSPSPIAAFCSRQTGMPAM